MTRLPEAERVAGVDVGGRRKGFHAVMLDAAGGVSGRHSAADPGEIAAWCVERGAKLVAVDAPCAWSTDGRSRPAEVALRKVRIQCFSTPSRETALAHARDHFGWMLNGERMFQALASSHPITSEPIIGVPGSIETFPQAVACALAGSVVSAKQKGTVRRELLRVQGLDTTLLTNIDLVDAALCAVAARYVLLGKAYAYGEPASGLIWVPKLRPGAAPEQLRQSSPDPRCDTLASRGNEQGASMALIKAEPQSVTLLDVQLARIWLPYLVALALERRTCTYSQLIEMAKRDHPHLPEVQKAIPVSAGRRLDVIKHYCEAEGLPDLASLVVGKASGECGSFPGEHTDPAAVRAEVYAKDWSEILPGIEAYFEVSTNADAPRKSRKEQATQLMADHYKLHRARYPASITSQRDLIVQMLMEGMEPEEAFSSAVAQLLR